MKTLIFAIILLFTANTSGSTHKEMSEEERIIFLANMIEVNMLSAQLDDIEIYYNYLVLTYNHGSKLDKQKLAMKYALCHIMFNQAVSLEIKTDNLDTKILRFVAWRGLVGFRLMVKSADGTEAQADRMLARLKEGEIIFTPNKIHTCTALDMAIYENMMKLGINPFPPGDDNLEPEPKKNQLAS